VGFLFPVGTQIPFALLFAYILRAKKILTIIFTFPTNIYTMFFIYPVQCWVGGKLCGIPLRFSVLRHMFRDITSEFSLENFLELSVDVITAFFAGGLLFALLSATIGYFAVYGMIMSYRQRIQKRLSQKLISKHEE
jgi:uncharacterized protein (DUF2062 family)